MSTTAFTTTPVITLTDNDGLQGAGFHIENPNAQRSCGCGKSFA